MPKHAPPSQARLRLLEQVTASLALTAALSEQAEAMLGHLATGEGWEAGMLWLSRESDGLLQLAASWSVPRFPWEELASLSRQTTFLPGQSPLGHAWGRGEQALTFDLTLESRSPRALYAAKAGLQWVTYYPITDQGTLMGFFEFFGRTKLAPEGERARLVTACGRQLVQRVHQERTVQGLSAPGTT